LTVAYGYAAQAAIAADRLETARRLDPASFVVEATPAARIWNGGTLAPITVEASKTAAVTPPPPTQCSQPRSASGVAVGVSRVS